VKNAAGESSTVNDTITLQSTNNSVVGVWEISGTVTMKVNIAGYGDTRTESFEDEYIFYSNGNFQMFEIGGRWNQNGDSFNVYLNSKEIEVFFEEGLGYYGKVDVVVKQNDLNGSVNGNNINGKWTLKMDIKFLDFNAQGNVESSANFNGTRISGERTLLLGKEKPSPEPRRIPKIIMEKFENLIQGKEVFSRKDLQ
jgi:hypothetical protein